MIICKTFCKHWKSSFHLFYVIFSSWYPSTWSVILHCEILFGNQISDIYWQHNSYNLSISNNQKYDESSTVYPNLIIKNVTYDYAGIYTCKARSLTGTGRGLAMTLNVIARIEGKTEVLLLEYNFVYKIC